MGTILLSIHLQNKLNICIFLNVREVMIILQQTNKCSHSIYDFQTLPSHIFRLWDMVLLFVPSLLVHSSEIGWELMAHHYISVSTCLQFRMYLTDFDKTSNIYSLYCMGESCSTTCSPKVKVTLRVSNMAACLLANGTASL